MKSNQQKKLWGELNIDQGLTGVRLTNKDNGNNLGLVITVGTGILLEKSIN